MILSSSMPSSSAALENLSPLRYAEIMSDWRIRDIKNAVFGSAKVVSDMFLHC